MIAKSNSLRKRGIANSALSVRLGCVGLVLLLLFSCNDDTSIPVDDVQTAYLEVGIDGLSTYANTIVGTDAENEIKSVAFFVVTTGGEFSKYLSTEPLYSKYGLSTTLSGTPGSYKASATLTASSFAGTTTIYVIGNYAQNGLTNKLLAINTLADLQNLQSIALVNNGTNLQCPLLMYTKKSLVLTAGGTTNSTINLQRVVARVDVIDHIKDASKFKLISVQVFNPKSKAYLLPSVDNPQATLANIATIPQITKSIHQFTDKTISLYAYETAGTVNGLLTIQVVYEFNGTGYIQDFPFKDKDSNTIRIERNKRYTINFSIIDGKLSFTSTVIIDDIDEGGDIDIPIG